MNPNGNTYANVLIRVNPASFEKRMNITGEIWLELDSFAYPSHSWWDFPVIVLSWWLDALPLLRSVGNAEFLFMDGPHAFEVGRRGSNVMLRCLDDPRGEAQCVRETVVNVNDLSSQITNAASIVVRECRERGWLTADTRALESKLSAFVSQSA